MSIFPSKLTTSIPIPLAMVCVYIFLLIERPWESVKFLHGVPIERPFAIIMLAVAIFSRHFKLVTAPSSKWIYMMLVLHLVLIEYSFNPSAAADQTFEYAKNVFLFVLILGVADDEVSLKVLIQAFIFSMLFYMLHSFWEYGNGRHVWRMGVSRMIGVDSTNNSPNAFGASIVLSLPFVYALLKSETSLGMRKVYYAYCVLAVLCIVATGSRSAFAAFVLLLIIWAVTQTGWKRISVLLVVLMSLTTIWLAMPEEKQGRIRTLWDKDAGPSNAYDSAQGRLVGWKVSWEMFKQKPLTGVGAGGANFIGYRMANDIDTIVGSNPSPTQSHILYGQVLAQLGVLGALLFAGLVFSIWRMCVHAKKRFKALYGGDKNFPCSIANAILASLILLLFLGFAGHNFYRDLWLWFAAWSGSLMIISEKIPQRKTEASSPIQIISSGTKSEYV